MKEQIVKCKVHCPRCKNSKTLTLVEAWKDHTISWQVEGGKFDRNDGALEMGDPFMVQATCPCGHTWKVRKALQIDDVTE
jgi:hypothetical protein